VESPALLIIMMWLDVTPLGGEETRSKHGATEKWRKHRRQINLLLLEQYVSQETTLFVKQLNLPAGKAMDFGSIGCILDEGILVLGHVRW